MSVEGLEASTAPSTAPRCYLHLRGGALRGRHQSLAPGRALIAGIWRARATRVRRGICASMP